VDETSSFIFQESIGGSNPKCAASVLREAADVVGCKGGGVFLIEDFEIEAVETRDAAFGRDPDVAVPALEDLVNAVLREPVLRGPILVAKVAEILWPGAG